MMYLLLFVVICVVVGLWMRHVSEQRIKSEAKIMNSAIAEGSKAANDGKRESDCPYPNNGTDPKNVPIGVLGLTESGEAFKGPRFWWLAGYRNELRRH